MACHSFLDLFSQNSITEINKNHIDTWINSLTLLADTTVNIRTRSLKTVFSFGVHKDLINKNPFAHYKHKRLKSPYSETDEVRYLSKDEIQIFRDHLNGWLLDAFNLALWTGLRAEGVFLTNYNNISHEKNKTFLKVIEKGNKDRWIPLSDKAQALISQRREYIRSANLNNSSQRAIEGFIFPEITRAHSISQAFGRARNKLFSGKDKITFHGLRHSFAVYYLEKGGRPERLQSILGHASIETTLRIYGKITKKAKAENINALTDI